MKDYISVLLGNYVPITTGEGFGTLDIPYIFGGIIFVLVLSFTLRCVYAVFFKK